MDFLTDFFKDEVRCGFYIPTAIKQAWAAELMVLWEIDRICTRHNIKYYAEWGTMLGAIRHGGFVPWDDDMDIGMLREDYIRFRQVAAKELPKEYAIHDYESKDNHWLFLSKVVNRNHICFEEEHLKKYHNFPYIAAVDIFVLDYLYNDEKQEKERCDEIKIILALADGIVEKGITTARMQMLKTIEQKYNRKLSHIQSTRQLGIELYRLAEEQMARVDGNKSSYVGQIFPWILKGNKGISKEYYEHMVRLPFENTTIPVPADYNTVMQKRYGNYMEICKVWDGHDYPYFEGQRKNLQAVADFKLPEFTFNPDMLNKNIRQTEDKSLKEVVKEYMAVIYEQMDSFETQAVKNKCLENYDILPECQQLAVDLGTLLENVKGENNPNVKEIVSCLEMYCEAIYQTYELLTGKEDVLEKQEFIDSVEASKKAYEVIKKAVDEKLLQKKVILFITTGSKQWNGLKNICQSYMSDKENEVYGVLAPVVFKDFLGRAAFNDTEQPADMKFFPEKMEVRKWNDIDISLLRPDIIYIQEPYDSENPCLTIPPQFYAESLRNYTDSLIYVPAFHVNEFGEQDVNDVYNMKHYVTAPAVIYADYILLQSENMKRMYIKKLIEFAGEETYEIWDEKLKVTKLYDNEILSGNIKIKDTETNADKADIKEADTNKADNKRDHKKIFVYCIGENELAKKKYEALKEIKERLESFAENSSRLRVKICMYPPDINVWEGLDSSLTQSVMELIEEYAKQEWCEICDTNTEKWESIAKDSSAYYGSPSPLVQMIAMENKPVMISR